MNGHLYLIVEWDRIEEDVIPCKIGVTRGCIQKRIKKLQTGNNSNLYMFDFFKSEHPFKLEKMIHRHYHKYNTNGEWFNLPNDVVMKFKSLCEEKEKLINFLLKENYYYGKRKC